RCAQREARRRLGRSLARGRRLLASRRSDRVPAAAALDLAARDRPERRAASAWAVPTALARLHPASCSRDPPGRQASLERALAADTRPLDPAPLRLDARGGRQWRAGAGVNAGRLTP